MIKNGNILVVEDNPLIRMNHKELIELRGFRAMTAGNLCQALKLITCRSYDLIVCDHNLPDGKGNQLLKQLADRRLETPVIYLSANTVKELPTMEQYPNLKEIMRKPIQIRDLLESILSHILQSKDDIYPRLIGFEERSILLHKSETPRRTFLSKKTM